jgi:hypothetical protein
LLDGLQKLFPDSLQWGPYGSYKSEQSAYAINLFLAAGIHAKDIAYVRTSRNGDINKYDATNFTNSTNSNVERLYIHTIRHFFPFTGIETNNIFKIVDNGYTFDLGAIALSSSRSKVSAGHAICGFKSVATQYLYNGHLDPNSPHNVPCKPYDHPTWKDLFSDTGYYIDNECNMSSEGKSNMLFQYPFGGLFKIGGGFFGMGVVNHYGKPIPGYDDTRTLTDINDMKMSSGTIATYLSEFNTHITDRTREEFAKIDGATINEKVDGYILTIYTLLSTHDTFLSLSPNDTHPPYDIRGCIFMVLKQLLSWACKSMAWPSFNALNNFDQDGYNKLRTKTMKNFGHDVHDVLVLRKWIADIIIYTCAQEYKEAILNISPMLKGSLTYDNLRNLHCLDGIANVIVCIVKPICIPVNIALEYAQHAPNKANVQSVTDWAFRTARSNVNKHITTYERPSIFAPLLQAILPVNANSFKLPEQSDMQWFEQNGMNHVNDSVVNIAKYLKQK